MFLPECFRGSPGVYSYTEDAKSQSPSPRPQATIQDLKNSLFNFKFDSEKGHG